MKRVSHSVQKRKREKMRERSVGMKAHYGSSEWFENPAVEVLGEWPLTLNDLPSKYLSTPLLL